MSYSGTPTPGSVSEVRFLVGDTDTAAEQLTDAEYQYLIDNWGEGIVAAAMAARMLQGKYAKRADSTVGDVSLSASQLAANYGALAASLDAKVSARAVPTMGGVDVAAVAAAKDDATQVQPAFERNEFNNPLAVNTTGPFDNTGGL